VPQRLVIFDCDGVLVDSEPISFAVLREVLAESGITLPESRAYRNFLGKSMAAISQLIAEEFHRPITDAQLETMRKRLYARLEAELQPVAGVADMLPRLGRPYCVASSSQPERIRLSLRRTGLIAAFEPNIFSASMVRNGKPAPDLFLLAAERMGFAPERCVVVEDSPAGIQAARHAGMPVFAFTGASHAAISDLESSVAALQPTCIFDDMLALPELIERFAA